MNKFKNRNRMTAFKRQKKEEVLSNGQHSLEGITKEVELVMPF